MKKILFLFLTLLLSRPLFAATFVVTSNADTGPGTLRQALLDAAANGSAEKDYINFNLPDLSVAGRTITLLSQLPNMTSNLVIDGSTQPGAKFGVSDTKVKLLFPISDKQKLSALKAVGQDDIEVYGLYLKGDATITDRQTTLYFYWNGIEFKNGKRITIGAAGKGNVVWGFNNDVFINPPDNTFEFFEDLTVKANFIGVDADGKTLSPNTPQTQTFFWFLSDKVEIGGTEAEGNIFAYGLGIYQVNNGNYPSTNLQDHYASEPADILIKNNKIGIDFSGQNRIPGTKGLYLITVSPGGKSTYTIEDNVILADEGATTIYIGNNGYPMYFRRNYIGTDKTKRYRFQAGTGFFLSWSDKVNIGSNNPADANYVTATKPVYVGDFATASVNKNSFYCTTGMGPMVVNGFTRPVTTINITGITANSVTGKATPNSAIELFYADACGTCSPETYFGSTTANASGDWQYTGPIIGKVIASATFNNSTSEFTGNTIDVSNLQVIHACSGNGGLGSILRAVPSNGASVQWLNESGAVVGTNADLIKVQPGKYKLVLAGGDCNAETPYYEIKTLSMQIDATGMVKKDESCGKYNGGLKGLTVVRNTSEPLQYSWKSAFEVEVSKKLELENVAAGSYTLTVSGYNNSCPLTYGPVVIKTSNGPTIDQSAAITTPTNCGQAKGSITNIIVTNGTGTLKYAWMDAAGKTVGTTKDLINQPGGVYTLQVTDDTQCGPVYSTAIAITEVNGVTLDDSQKILTQPSCKYNGGSITNLKFIGATIFKWYNGANPNAVIATTADLANVTAGNYYLVASNAGGCSVTSPTYAITFQKPTADIGGLTKKLTNATCGLNNGRIEVIYEKLPLPAGAVVSYRWVNHATNQTERTTTTPVLTDIDAGAYDVYITNSAGCENYLITYSIGRSASITVNSTNAKVVNDACATGSGSIKGVTVSGSAALTYLWADAAGKPVGNNADLINIKAGSYTLTVTATDLNCSQTYGPVNIIDGSAVKIDQSAAVITPTNCGVKKGSITNITVSGTGTLKYTWKNPLGATVGTNKDLTNQPGGVYTLQVIDDSQCGPVYSTAITIAEINGIVIDDSQKVISNANCQLDNGSITGIKVPGATFYKWYSVNNQVVSTDVNLTGVPIGNYYLVAANGNGCSATSSTYVIARDNGTDFGTLTKLLKNATCGANNGSIEIGFTNPSAPRPTGYRWVNHVTGATIKRTTNPILTDLDAGVYDIYVTISTMVCEQLLSSCVIERNPGLDVVTANAKVTDDACDGNTGSITGIGITGTSPLSYYWMDDKNNIVSNALDLKNVKAGAYLLNVKDGSGCQEGVAFNINSSTLALTAPVVKEIQLCSAGDAVINLPGLTSGYGYRLYNNLTDNQPADVSITGKFKIKAAKSRSYYVSVYAGNCESGKAEIKISVGISLQNLVNTFSPNGDGINDTWKIPGIENYAGAVVQIFNRSGDKVFNAIGYETPFDGNYKGKPLPTGTYYYIVNLNSGCSLLSGNLTIIR